MTLNKPLLGVNFFAGDVLAGLGPYLAIYLLSVLKWAPGSIGIALALSTICTVIVQTPAGGIVDTVRWKRGLLAVCAMTIAVSAVAITFFHSSFAIYAAQMAIGVALAFVGPAIAAITLGLVGPEKFTAQTSANQAWNHAGNMIAAGLAAGIALWISVLGVFWLIAMMTVGMVVCIWMIKADSIDHDVARGGETLEGIVEKQPSGFATLINDRRLRIFAISVVLFHFANAAMLPLVSQKLSENSDAEHGIAFTSACIIAAQLVMILMALFCGWKADVWGRKPLFLLAFAVLPIRGVLFTLGDEAVYLIAIQALDGVANGIFAMLFLLILADITAGTGRFNLSQGALATLVGVGASLSNLIAEEVVGFTNYTTGFLMLAAVGLIGLIIFALFMPETAPHITNKTKEP
ncbi:MFS transporter [Sneathiella marina]|uniref:MFS transporter n=1 Tax=Sneathiella marina TaxID=2950108 RepID=A0ABY4W4G0_9PROT|nr:MFS transporter [Sneathiella marina]USG61794.1 MFS transporter [Sneathiella marina]